MRLEIQRLEESARLPTYAHPGDAGLDLYSRESLTVRAGEWAVVPTGVALAIPDDSVGLVVPRSGLAAQHGITVLNSPGIIDSGFRGEVSVILVNHGRDDYAVRAEDRVAQLIVLRNEAVSLIEVQSLQPSARGSGGFGHTGR